ncbi:MAG: hypothetical protein GY874_15330 [Desulfobacteraceae bacterium]|nr:hypothetical protein [Desulfobacteraceae bacterium]
MKKKMATLNDIANMTFKRVPGKDISTSKSNLQIFNILLAMDGTRSVAAIAKEDFYDLAALVNLVSKLVKKGLLEKTHGNTGSFNWDESNILENGGDDIGNVNISPNFFDGLEEDLSKMIGPVARILIEDNTTKMGFDTYNFPIGRVPELLEKLAVFIQNQSDAIDFKRRMMAQVNSHS